MKMNEMFPSRWLSAADLNGAEPTVIIDRVLIEEIGQNGDCKPVVYFKGKEKGLVLNKTNGDRISYILRSDETNDWAGQSIKLYTELVNFQGSMKHALRVKAADQRQAQIRPAARQPAAMTAKLGPEPPQIGDDEIPF